MAQTDVNIDSNLIADRSDVPVVQGDTLTVTASGRPATLFFSHDCQSHLSPSPGAYATLAAGATATYTFTSSAPGNYVIFVAGDSAGRPHFPPIKSTTLAFTTYIPSVRGTVGPSNQLQGS